MDSLSGFAESVALMVPLAIAALIALAAAFWLIRSGRRDR
jgi:nitrogen fixation-related uncharacterized protein